VFDMCGRCGRQTSVLMAVLQWYQSFAGVGQARDVDTILHECGHAFHAWLSRGHDLFFNRNNMPLEFQEVASMSMELLGAEHMEEFYPNSSSDADRARAQHLGSIIELFPWIAAVDAFQHWVYANPGHTATTRAEKWDSILSKLDPHVDWSGYEDVRRHLWHRQVHIFTDPFYFIEYGIAQLGALQVWANARQDKAKALRDFKAALALGTQKPLPELFAAAGAQFDMGRDTMRPLVEQLWTELNARRARVDTSGVLPSLAECLATEVEWEAEDALRYVARVGPQRWNLVVRSFPDEPMYGLWIDDKRVGDVEGFPRTWKKPKEG